ncbi:MAG: SDR family oxidoreductase [Dehalococcoidales bacterium]|nr:SDR family oxidoreductase [Dehalococcoidales bacterium]
MTVKRRPRPVTPLKKLVSLEGKRALITGAAAGIGRAISYRFAEAGADLELVDINAHGLTAVRKELEPFKREVTTHKVDISSREAIDALWETLKGKEPDILVNNAGIYPFKSFMDTDEEFLKNVMDINLQSAVRMCRHMIQTRIKKGGVIINTSSIEAVMPFAEGLVAYDISKIGVIGLTRGLAKEYGHHGFRINCLLPGGIHTPGTRAVAKEAAKFNFALLKTGYDFKARLPMGRGGQPDEVARVALFLASDLSSYVHGALVPADGGFLSA